MRIGGGSAGPGSATTALRACALFGAMDDASVEAVARLLRTRRFRRNEVVFHAGDPGDALFVVESGSVKIVLASVEGEEAIIATLGPGEFFGELAILDGAERSATAVALEPTALGSLGRAPFLELVAREPGIRVALLAALAGELRRLTRHVEELHFLALPGRLALRLVELAHPSDAADPAAVVSGHYTQSDLASMIGCSRQTVNRLLGDFAAEGLIRVEHDTIHIPDLEALARVAGR